MGEPHIVFATAGSDGGYDSLAGGASIAAKPTDSSYGLPNSVSKAGVLTFRLHNQPPYRGRIRCRSHGSGSPRRVDGDV